jgi:hypothetical protein
VIDRLACTIERRLLLNFRLDPERVASVLPAPFRPQLVGGWAVGGICFIRLGGLRPPWLPRALGLTSENMAHRFAVEWDDGDGARGGVYIPRRDTSSRLATLAGGRVFPGAYESARFSVTERGPQLSIDVDSRDGRTRVAVRAHEVDELGGSLFGGVEEAVGFFRAGSQGFAPSSGGGCVEGVALESAAWDARPVRLEHVSSSFFEDVSLFPAGSCVVDSGLVMRDLPARWVTAGRLETPAGALTTAS